MSASSQSLRRTQISNHYRSDTCAYTLFTRAAAITHPKPLKLPSTVAPSAKPAGAGGAAGGAAGGVGAGAGSGSGALRFLSLSRAAMAAAADILGPRTRAVT